MAMLGLWIVSFFQRFAQLCLKGAGRLSRWYLYYVHSPNNPVDRAAQRVAQRLQVGMQKIGRGSIVAMRRLLLAMLAPIAALGPTLVAGYFVEMFVEGPWPGRVLVVGAFVASVVTFLSWFATAPSVGALVERFRLVIVTVFLALSGLGLFVAASSIYSLFD